MNELIQLSQSFWHAMEVSDEKSMREIASKDCYFVHIGGNCNLDQEVRAYSDKLFVPTSIVIHSQKVNMFHDCGIVYSDVDYTLLLDGKETTHHFMVTEVYNLIEQQYKLISFTFTALVY